MDLTSRQELSRFLVVGLMAIVGFAVTSGAISQVAPASGKSADPPHENWTEFTTSYFDESDYKEEVAASADFWNRSGALVLLR